LPPVRSSLRTVVSCVWAALGLPLMLSGSVPTAVAGVAHLMTPAAANYAQFNSLGTFQDLVGAQFPCQKTVPAACFGPDQIRAAYGIQPVLNGSITGKGRTIVLVDAFQSPSLENDLATFDAIFHLPPPAALNVIYPDGPTAFNAHDPVQIGWSLEIAVDVEWAHAIAPGAAIVLVLAKSGDDADLTSALTYAVKHKLNGSRGSLGDVMSLSFGEAEQCASKATIAGQHRAFELAKALRMTVFAASGDQGATQPTCDGRSLLGVRAVATPASDPNVTAVGGTHLIADGATGAYQSESGWTGSGGGFSSLYRRPEYQESLGHETRGRGVPDVAFNSDPHSGPIVVWSLLAPPGNPGLGTASGTSAAAPQWAGIAALADQAAGRRLGLLNNSLYEMGRGEDGGGAFHDITSGNNSFGGVAGFSATPGWDAVTGLGTPNVAKLVHLFAERSDRS
jgi:subtilase family serine protease